MNTTLTELQQFFGAYFNQDWVDDHACADDVIDAFLMDSSKYIICTVRNQILKLMDVYTDESKLLESLLHEQYCYYYYPNEWASGPLWLHHIIEKFDTYLLKE
jgi:hypothetical protein